MIKFFGLLLIFTACFALGLTFRQMLRERVETLSAILDALKNLGCEIRFQRPLVSIFESQNSGVFKKTALKLSNNRQLSASKAFCEAVADESSLSPDDKNVLISFGRGLSAEDADGQIKNIDLTTERVKLLIEESKEKLKSREGLYVGLSLTIGAFIVIILI